ncbi:hypothetical protein K1T71_002799 [Dendrolimus kikuchii]|uniref:Uncharacterized protein n=1 Tax=Dendrolimus kikuchii TaxID=765133 RepID=A0ACC1DF82_9NEOP|nr:hypothetical protein K1T71_002799 [Dendrolimus kikuchii]
MMGLFNLIEPLKLVDGKLRRRNVTWASHYSLLFIDNPVGTGFSFTNDEKGYPKNEDDLGEQLFIFLQQFLEIFPELQKAPLFITGESYAGKYVPALGIQLHRHKGDGVTINLRGMAIGNGLIDPLTMMHYSSLCQTLALEKSIIKHIKDQKMVEAASNLTAIIAYVNKYSGVNIYHCLEDPKTLDKACETYLERVENRQLIHVGNTKFTFDNALMYNKMFSDIMNTTKPFLEELLEHYGVMLYSGQLDIMVPYASSRNIYKALKWSRSEEYAEAPRQNIGKQSIEA